MADVATRFRAFLLGDASIARKVGPRVHQNTVPAQRAIPFVWFRRRTTGTTTTLDSSAGEAVANVTFDVEAVAINQTAADELAEAVRARCHCYRGAFDDGSVQAIFVEDQDEDYVPVTGAGDDGMNIATFLVQIWPA